MTTTTSTTTTTTATSGATSRSALSRSLPFAASMVLPLLAALAVFVGGPWLWAPPLFMFLATPVMDALLGTSRAIAEPSDAAPSSWRDLRFDLWLWLWAPVQLAIQGGALVVAARAVEEGAPAQAVGVVSAAGLLGGLGINVAHELMHRKGRAERALAELLMTSVCYPHFCVEHVLGHHRTVATPEDPASARRGEVVYAFWLRTIVGGVSSAWRLERARVAKLGVPWWLDRRLRYPLVVTSVIVAVGVLVSPIAALAFLGQSLIAVLLLETINYIEHYGLQRARVDGGSYERVAPAHSWNSSARLTNLYLFHLPRHADHHETASRPFYALRALDDAPELPAGYATMLIVALVPPLWFRIMDPRLRRSPHGSSVAT